MHQCSVERERLSTELKLDCSTPACIIILIILKITFDFPYACVCVHLCVIQALLEFLSKVVSREKRNRMNLWAVATIMAPNLFLHKAVPSRLTEGAEKGHAEKAADVMRLLIRYQDLLWTVRPPAYSVLWWRAYCLFSTCGNNTNTINVLLFCNRE